MKVAVVSSVQRPWAPERPQLTILAVLNTAVRVPIFNCASANVVAVLRFRLGLGPGFASAQSVRRAVGTVAAAMGEILVHCRAWEHSHVLVAVSIVAVLAGHDGSWCYQRGSDEVSGRCVFACVAR